MDSKLLRYALIIVEVTSIPLIVVGLIYLLTGYQMLEPSIEIFMRPRALHTDVLLRVATIALGTLHAYGGLLLLIARRVRKPRTRHFLFVITTLLLILALSLFITLELTASSTLHTDWSRPTLGGPVSR